MADWVDLNLLSPDAVQSIVDTAETVTDALTTVLEVLAAIAEIIKWLQEAILDPIAAIVEAIIQTIRDWINDLKAAAVHVLAIYPRSLVEFLSKTYPSPSYKIWKKDPAFEQMFADYKEAKKELGLPWFYETLEKKLNDPGDPKRPMVSDSAAMAGIIVLVGAPNIFAFLDLLEALYKLFKIPEFKDMKRVKTREPYVFATLTKDAPIIYSTSGYASQNVYVTSVKGFPKKGKIKILSTAITGFDPLKWDKGADVYEYSLDVMESEFSRPSKFGTKVIYVKDASNLRKGESVFITSGAKIDTLVVKNVKQAVFPSISGGTWSPDWEVTLESPTSWDYDVGATIKTGDLSPFAFKDITVMQHYHVGDRVVPLFNEQESLWPYFWMCQPQNLIPFYGTIITLLEGLLALLEPASSIADLFDAFIEALLAKIQQISDIIQKLKDAIQDFLDALSAMGLKILPLASGSGGTMKFMADIRSAGNQPKFGGDAIVGGLVILAGGPGIGGIEKIKTLCGL